MYFVYQVTNTINGKMYIGMTKHLNKRFQQHQYAAIVKKYYSAFHNAINKYGIDSFQFEVIYCSLYRDDVLEKETHFIREHKTTDINFGYNLTDGGEGTSYTPERRAKISAANRRRMVTDETKAKLSAINRGKIIPVETRAKLSASLKGRVVTVEARKKISTAHKGRVISVETRRKLSESNKGKFPSLKTRNKISDAGSKIRVISTPEGIEVVHKLKNFCKDRNLNYRSALTIFQKHVEKTSETPYKTHYFCLGVL